MGAAMYMQESIEALRRDIDKHGKAKVKKGQQAPPAAKVVHADLFVSDRFTGWRERVFINLSQLYSQQTRGFPADVSQQMMDEGRALSEQHEGAGAEEDCDALCPDAHEGDQPAGP
ncbi:hypothetical protein WJX82_009298 [Trebouxia sp. C0006]